MRERKKPMKTVSRRSLAKGAAWAAPAIIATSQVPTYAASALCQNDAVAVSGVTYTLIGAESNKVEPYHNGVTVYLNGDGKSTWSENPGYEVTFTYTAVRDIESVLFRVYISGTFYTTEGSVEGRVANVIDRSFANGQGYEYTVNGDATFTNATWHAGQIGQIRDAATSQSAILPSGAYSGYAINHKENEKIFAAYDSNQVGAELRVNFSSIKAGTSVSLKTYVRFAELNNYGHMAQAFGLDYSWKRPIMNAGMVSDIYFKEPVNRGTATGGRCRQNQSLNMATYDGDLTDEQPIKG